MRVQENDGQEITFADLNRIMQLQERNLHERILYHFVDKQSEGQFQDSFFVDYTDATHVSVRAGIGIQLDGTQVSPETTKRLLYRASAVALEITAPNVSNPRIDLVVGRADRINTATQSRQVKDFVTSVVSPQNIVVETDWEATLQIVAGTPNASPVAPSIPSGFVLLATLAVAANTGLASQVSITDNRVLMPVLENTKIDTSDFDYVPTKAVGTKLKQVLAELDALAAGASQVIGIYDGIVGNQSWATHSTLASAVAGLAAGARILVTQNQVLNSSVALSKANMEIHLKPGVVISKGSATTGLEVSASGVEIHGGKMSGFSAGGDKAINYQAAATYGKVWGMRFASCDTMIDDSAVDVVQFGNIEE